MNVLPAFEVGMVLRAAWSAVLPRRRYAWLALLGLTACAANHAGRAVLARSDLGPVTRAEVEAYTLGLPEKQQRPGRGEDLARWRSRITEELLAERALEAEARKELAENPRGGAQLDEARRTALVDAFQKERVEDRVAIDEVHLRRYYDEHPGEFGHPEQIRLRHIFRRVSRTATPQEKASARAEMEHLLERLHQGAHFGDLARQYSDSETASLDGLIGRLTHGALDPSIEEIVWNLKEGEVSPVVATPVGFHIFRLDNRLPAEHLSFEEARGRLLRRLQREERERLLDQTFDQLLAETGASYHPELLAQRPPASPEATLFALGEVVLTVAQAEAYRQTAPFVTLRRTPVAAWLKEHARASLFLAKAEQEPFVSQPEVREAVAAAERRALIRGAQERRVRAKLLALDDSGVLDTYYDDNYRRFQSPKSVRLRLIHLRFDQRGQAYDVYERLARLAEEIRAGRKDMAEAARELSVDPSAPEGGDAGWVLLDGIGIWAGPTAQKRVASLKVGELTDPVLVERYDQSMLTYDRDGYVLVRKEEQLDPQVRPYSEVLGQVMEKYRESHQGELEAEIRRELLASIHARLLEQ